MKQVAQNYRSGELAVLDAPPPACKPGGVVVRTLYSLISTGTEVMKVSEANKSLLGMARARPDQVKKVLDTVAQQGPVSTYKKVMNRLDSYTPLGYSLCGVVTEVGRGAEELKVGQLVACAGNEHALHAELNWVPLNLCVPVPDGVAPQFAAFATVGAIAMHGVRRAEVQLGDTACVVGLGLIGQLVVQLLVAAGVRVVGLDTVEERCRLAERSGARVCATATPAGVDRIGHALADMTGGLGADHVFLAAGGSSSAPVEAAAQLARDRARIVDIGKCRLDLPWTSYYEKELDVRFSRSYGPGRYDDQYELEGLDYPPGYVRWTERRNLACFVDMVARGELDLTGLVSEIFPVGEAADVYDRLSSGSLTGVGYLFQYPAPPLETERTDGYRGAATRPRHPRPRGHTGPRPAVSPGAKVRLGFIGAGNYASSMLLPHLAGDKGVELAHVVTTRSLSAVNAQRRFHFEQASTSLDSMLGDDTIDAVFIVTRHHSHAALTCRALEAGKTVFIEKPLALTHGELDRILETVEATGNDRVMVGFNRRFAPLLVDLRERVGAATGASVVRYLVNAGPLDAGSWYQNTELEGSRFVGEGGHFIDTLSWWLGSPPTEVYAAGAHQNQDLQVQLRYEDGSLATIAYVTGGNRRFPKETLDVSVGGTTARFDNFRRTTVWTGRRRRTTRARGGVDKGQRQQLQAFLATVRAGQPMPIRLPSLVATTRATIAVEQSLGSGVPEKLWTVPG